MDLAEDRPISKEPIFQKQASPAIMGMCSLRSLICLIDCREGRETMYVSPSGQDYDIQINGDQGRALPLVTASSGHIMLPTSGYQNENNHQEEVRGTRRDNRPNEWEVLSAESLR